MKLEHIQTLIPLIFAGLVAQAGQQVRDALDALQQAAQDAAQKEEVENGGDDHNDAHG